MTKTLVSISFKDGEMDKLTFLSQILIKKLKLFRVYLKRLKIGR